MPRPRSTYTAEFKLQAVKMITDQKLSIAEDARRLDVGENLLRAWKKAFTAGGDAAFPGRGRPTPATTSSAGCGPRSHAPRPSRTC